jgi:hypothetical protein
VSNKPDISYLNDAIHLMDGKHLIDTKVTAAETNVDQSKDIVVLAKRELERHQQWLERHRELYLKELIRAQRQLRRHDVIRACKQAVMVPMQLVSFGFVALLHGAGSTLANRAKQERLQNRINTIDHPSR